MKTLIMGTTNPAKIAQMRDILGPVGIDVQGVKDKSLLPEVVEDGKTAQENARKKSLAYAKALGQVVFSMDNALFLDGLTPDKQPNIHVRRIGGFEAVTDIELLEHGITLIKSIGEQTTGYWEYGICIAGPDGQLWEETVVRTPRIFTSRPSLKIIPGYPLESIQIDPRSGKYISEMSAEEKAEFWRKTLGKSLVDFVVKVLK